MQGLTKVLNIFYKWKLILLLNAQVCAMSTIVHLDHGRRMLLLQTCNHARLLTLENWSAIYAKAQQLACDFIPLEITKSAHQTVHDDVSYSFGLGLSLIQ